MYKNGKPNYNEIVFTEEQETEIINMYLNKNMSTVKIGKIFNTSHKPIAKVLERNGIPRTGVGQRKYKLNQEYFDNIDTQNKAYILGFFFADGNNCKEKSNIRMALQESDGYILEQIRKEIGSEKELTYIDNSNRLAFGTSKMKNQWQLDMYSTHMCEILESIGMIPNKSLVLDVPKLQDDMFIHFLRGYMDGDGTISSNPKHYSCGFISTYNFCIHVQKFLKEKYNIKSNVSIVNTIHGGYEPNGITSTLSITQKDSCKKFLDLIYNNAEMYLERKHNHYMNLFYNKE